MTEATPVSLEPAAVPPSAAPAPAASAAPPQPAPAPAPAAAVPAEPAPPSSPDKPTAAPAPVADAAPAPAPTPVAAAPAATPSPASLLGEAGSKPAAAPQPEPPAAVSQEAPPVKATAPVYESFKLPDGASIDEEVMGKFTTDILAAFETDTKADHAKMQDFGQKLVDFHVAEVQRVAERIAQANLQEAVRETDAMREAFVSDPELGGNRQQTTLQRAGEMIEQYGGTPEQKAALREEFNRRGSSGNSVHLIRLLNNVYEKMREGQPVVGQKPPVTPMSREERRYGRSRPNGAGATA